MGFQFENLVLNNIKSICSLLSINVSSVVSASPYFQRKTQRQQACQVDLLIQSKYTFYVCELKFCKKVTQNVIKEVQEKIAKTKFPKNMTIRPILIYEGELAMRVDDQDYFDRIISFADILRIA